MVQSYGRITKRGDFHFLSWNWAISRKICVCNRSMPSTATTVEYEVPKIFLGVGLHVATSHFTSASVEGDFRFDEVKWIICWHSANSRSFGTYKRSQYDNKITIPRRKNLAEFVLGPIFDVAIENPWFGSHHITPLPAWWVWATFPWLEVVNFIIQ